MARPRLRADPPVCACGSARVVRMREYNTGFSWTLTPSNYYTNGMFGPMCCGQCCDDLRVCFDEWLCFGLVVCFQTVS